MFETFKAIRGFISYFSNPVCPLDTPELINEEDSASGLKR
jgi:hypothetical protein